jgi:putative ubiquitin-RnfH superfamily antitoxin RatB of RatAB toxin-antitoxin module
MEIAVAYAEPARQVWIKLDLPEGSSVREAIERSGVLAQFPNIELEETPVGIFGKRTQLDAQLADGDRVELYRPITADPETVQRRDT